MISQTNSHLHMTAQWLVPVIVWLVVRLLRAVRPGPDPTPRPPSGRPSRMVTSAVGLAAAVTVQVFIGEEVLFLTALTLLVMAVGYAVADRDLARRALPGFAGRAGDRRRPRAAGARRIRCGSSSPARRASPTGCSARPTSPPT